MLRSIAVGSKTVNVIEQLYDKIQCAVIITGHITDWFEVKVRCASRFPALTNVINIFLEFVMDKTFPIRTLSNILQICPLKLDMQMISAKINFCYF